MMLQLGLPVEKSSVPALPGLGYGSQVKWVVGQFFTGS